MGRLPRWHVDRVVAFGCFEAGLVMTALERKWLREWVKTNIQFMESTFKEPPTELNSVLALLDENEKFREALKFYRDERNWLKQPNQVCSAIIADTGSRAKQALAEDGADA